MMNDLHDLKVLIESRVPLITLETHEAARADEWTLFS